MNCKYLVAAVLLIGLTRPLLAQSVTAGIDAWQRADYAGAVTIWRPLAEKGDADAEFNLGQAYRLGRGVQTNVAAAKIWFERAANQGHVDAQTTLGLLLFEAGDQPNGLKWLKKAADQGEPRALLVFGTALVNGDSVQQDPVLGYAYVSRAAAQGLGPAKQTLDQLDQLLPIADRRRGVAIARDLAKEQRRRRRPPLRRRNPQPEDRSRGREASFETSSQAGREAGSGNQICADQSAQSDTSCRRKRQVANSARCVLAKEQRRGLLQEGVRKSRHWRP